MGASPKYFHKFHLNGRMHIRCELCSKYLVTVKMHSQNNKLPEIVENHLISSCHRGCVNVARIGLLTEPDTTLAPMDSVISKANRKWQIISRFSQMLRFGKVHH